MLQSRYKFKNLDLERLAQEIPLPSKSNYKNIERILQRRLNFLLAATKWQDLFILSGTNPEKLKGTDLCSMRVNQQYRLIFKWQDNQAWEIDIDKHDKNYGK